MGNYDQGHRYKETLFPVANSFGDMLLFAYVYWIKEKMIRVSSGLYKWINLDRKINKLTYKRESRHSWMNKLGDSDFFF